MQLYFFIVTIGTFLPIKYYLAPVLIIYTGVYGLTYYYAEERDLCYFEAILTITINWMTSTFSAFIVRFAVDEAFKARDDDERLIIQIVKKQFDAFVVLDSITSESIFCTEKALFLLKTSEKEMSKVKLKQNWTIKTFGQVVS